MKTKPNPIPLAMVICDTIIDDRKTGKKSLIGLFNKINAIKTPSIHPFLNIFVSLTEGNGDYVGMLRFINTDENKTLAELTGNIVFQNPQQIIEFNFEMHGVPLPRFGNYRFDLFCNNELLISRKFVVSPSQTL